MRGATGWLVLPVCVMFGMGTSWADDSRRIEELETKLNSVLQLVEQLQDEVKTLRTAQESDRETQSVEREVLFEELESMRETGLGVEEDAWYQRFSLGGYGEIHYNSERGGRDIADIHRWILLTAYQFNDWILLEAELELEHALVDRRGDEGDGYLLLEQLHLNFLLDSSFNVRIGRLLMPMGIINQYHEPPTFYGVERPSVERVVIPSTWHSEGVGIFGDITDGLAYQLYFTNGLDGRHFSAMNGIRAGRQRERPSFNAPGATGRLDIYPFQLLNSDIANQELRLGASFFAGGVNNSKRFRDADEPGISGNAQLYSVDADYTLGPLDFRGVGVWGHISQAGKLNRDLEREAGNYIARNIYGYYLQAAWRFWPQAWKQGKLSESDAAIFVRFEDYDTQHRMPSGLPSNGAADRREWTAGLSFYPTDNVVMKADYQWRSNRSRVDPSPNMFNLGVGWMF